MPHLGKTIIRILQLHILAFDGIAKCFYISTCIPFVYDRRNNSCIFLLAENKDHRIGRKNDKITNCKCIKCTSCLLLSNCPTKGPMKATILNY